MSATPPERMTPEELAAHRSKGLRRTVRIAVGVAAVMCAGSFAAVPLYDLFCRVTGYGGAPVLASDRGASSGAVDDYITITFDASKAPDMPWTFVPVQREMKVRIGEDALAFYRATNPTDHPVAGQATYNVAPVSAGEFFVKIDCFCFTEQILQPGESVDMPVSFYVDPAIRENAGTRRMPSITLSYTFYRLDKPLEAASLAPAAQEAEGATAVH